MPPGADGARLASRQGLVHFPSLKMLSYRTEDPPRPLIDQNGNYWLPPTSFQRRHDAGGLSVSSARTN